MTAPVYLVSPALATAWQPGEQVLLDGAEGRHAATVRRTSPGEVVVLADGEGRWGRGEVVAVDKASVTILLASTGHDAVPPVRLVLVQALAKGGRDDQAIEAATELGVDEVIPWQAERSIVQWRGARAEKARESWRALLRSAAKQSRRTRVPALGPTVTTRALAARLAGASAAYVLHEDADQPLASQSFPEAGEVLVVVGPEGGITPTELSVLESVGARPMRLGPHVLRSSSAGPAALAVLCARLRWQA